MSQSEHYIEKVLNTDPTKFAEKGYFLRTVYDFNYLKHGKGSVGQRGGHAIYSSMSFGSMTNFAFGYNSGSSPWIMSQLFGGSEEYNLLRVHTLGHGEAENGRFKISIKNVKVSSIPGIDDFGSFDLEVRSFNNPDRSISSVESFPGLSLDITNPNYIAKRIGDRFWQWNETRGKMVSYGDYPNVSKLIRIEITTGSFPDTALPWGFRGLEKPSLMYISGTSGEGADEGDLAADVDDVIGDLPLVANLLDKKTQSEIQSYIYWGVEFELSGNVSGRFDKYPTMTGSDTDFSLRFISGSDATANHGADGGDATGFRYQTSLDSSGQKQPGNSTTGTTLEPKYAQFTVPIAFGFDGWDKRIEDPLDNETQLAATTQIAVQALRLGVDIIKDPDFIDINLLAIPGIYSTKITDYAIDEIENRADAFYISEFINHSSSATTVASAVTEIKNRSYDTNYAGVYYPAVKVVDDVNNRIVPVPPSALVLGAMAYNDRVAFPWFAPAGLNRGGFNKQTIGFNVVGVVDRLNASERDDLYENRVNPIASFPGEGVVIWGQKTLQAAPSALDRINVRRMLIKAKKLIASSTKYLAFEANNASTWTRFKQMVNPMLSDIQRKNGLEAFKVIMDETLNTPDLIDRNTMAGQIFMKPTRTAEIITLNFIISRSGAVFEE